MKKISLESSGRTESKMIKPGQTIGIIGGGQLGRMMGTCKRGWFQDRDIYPSKNSPCGQSADIEIVGPYNDEEKALE